MKQNKHCIVNFNVIIILNTLVYLIFHFCSMNFHLLCINVLQFENILVKYSFVILCFLLVSIAEVERLWMRFQQIGCNHDGILTPEAVTKSALPNDMLTKNVNYLCFL